MSVYIMFITNTDRMKELQNEYLKYESNIFVKKKRYNFSSLYTFQKLSYCEEFTNSLL